MSVAAMLGALVLLGGFGGKGAESSMKQQFRGTVVAYDEVASLINLTSAPQVSVVIVRVAKPQKTKIPEFAKVVFVWFRGEPELPPVFFEAGHRWRFLVSAVPAEDTEGRAVCDSPLVLPKWLDASAAQRIDDPAALKCFESSPSDVRKLSAGKK